MGQGFNILNLDWDLGYELDIKIYYWDWGWVQEVQLGIEIANWVFGSGIRTEDRGWHWDQELGFGIGDSGWSFGIGDQG